MGRIGEGCRDTTLWGMRLRLYPRRNGCEKNALFTPQMFDTMERRVLAEAVRRRARFTFVDIGANVGLYSLYLGSCGDVRTLAIEPQPGILERLRFHLAANPSAKVDVLRLRSPIAPGSHAGAERQRQRRHAHRQARWAKRRASASASHVSRCCRCCRRPVSGDRCAEDRRGGRRGHRAGAIPARRAGFAAAAPDPDRGYARLLGPRSVRAACARGYTEKERSRQNVALRLG